MFRRGKNKYGAKAADGFGSKLERAVYQKLKDREVLGLVRHIERQASVKLQEHPDKKLHITWKVDFRCEEKREDGSWGVLYVEAKGIETSDYKIKLKMFLAQEIGPIEIWKGSWAYPKLYKRYG